MLLGYLKFIVFYDQSFLSTREVKEKQGSSEAVNNDVTYCCLTQSAMLIILLITNKPVDSLS